MKNTFKLFGIFALVEVIGFTTASCGEDGGGGGGGGGGSSTTLGETPTLSGKVSVFTQDEKNYSISFPDYKGEDLTVSADGLTGKGAITNGQFSFALGKPEKLETFSNIQHFSDGYDELNASPSNAKGYTVVYFDIDGKPAYSLARENATVSVSGTSMSGTYEVMMYVYVDSDVTVSGKGKTRRMENDLITTKDYSLALKTGWNTVYTKQTVSQNQNGGTNTVELVLKNPTNLKWALN
jgi:hypothetical protein